MVNPYEILLERLALQGIIDRLRGLMIPAHAFSWTRFEGALLVALLAHLFLSGAFMAFYYSPAPGSAYDSVDFAMFSVPFGDIIKGIHHYAWNLLLIVMALHLGRAFFVGAYKIPREFVWISGLTIILIVPLFIITGDLLPWDQKGYWSTQVRLSIIASVPLVGDFCVRLLQGGPLTGIVALTRFYVLHIIFLPALLIFSIVVHFHFLSHQGLADPLFRTKETPAKVPFSPNMINRWFVLFILVTLILGAISWYWPAPLGDPADPTDSSYIPKPEWWVLFLNQLVTIFKGKLTLIGSVIIPGGLFILLALLPFIDRSPERHLRSRGKIILIAAVVVTLLLGLSIMGYIEHFVTPHS